MALGECTAHGILSRQPHGHAFPEQCAESQSLGGRPVEALSGLEHLGLVLHLPHDGLVGVEAFGNRRQHAPDIEQRFAGYASLAAPVAALGRDRHAGPAPVQPIGTLGPVRLGGVVFLVQPFDEAVDHFRDAGLGERTFIDQLRRVQFQRGRMVLDGAIH